MRRSWEWSRPRLDIGILQAREGSRGVLMSKVVMAARFAHSLLMGVQHEAVECWCNAEPPWSEASADSDFHGRALAFRPGEVTSSVAALPHCRNFKETSTLQDQPRLFHEGSAEEFRSLRSQTLHGPSCVYAAPWILLVQVVGLLFERIRTVRCLVPLTLMPRWLLNVSVPCLAQH